MELVETARIWYIDNDANITFQLFTPIIGGILLILCKELKIKEFFYFCFIILFFSGLLAVATAS